MYEAPARVLGKRARLAALTTQRPSDEPAREPTGVTLRTLPLGFTAIVTVTFMPGSPSPLHDFFTRARVPPSAFRNAARDRVLGTPPPPAVEVSPRPCRARRS